MLILLDGERFRTITDEWWVVANWNKSMVRTFETRSDVYLYTGKHGILKYRVAEVENVDTPPKSPDKVRLKKPIEVEFDSSNGQHYIFIAQLWFYDTSADVAMTNRPDVQAFASLGAAHAFYAHMGAKGADWVIENPNMVNQCWSLELAINNPHGAFKVTIHELLLVKR